MPRPSATVQLASDLADDHAAALRRRAQDEAVIRRFGYHTDENGWVTKPNHIGRAAFGKDAYAQQQRVLCSA